MVLFDWDVLIAYSFNYNDEQEVKLVVKYSIESNEAHLREEEADLMSSTSGTSL